MSQFKGFFELQKPVDLLAKLRHDYRRLQSSPTDTYAAFDFFVTGYHMLDWLYPNDKNKKRRREEEKASILLQVCSHIANGIKHFQATRKNHRSVADLMVQEGAFQRDAFQANAFQVEALIIKLDGQAAVQFGAEVECLALATQVLQHWENNPDMK
jgi:hypothetical protein